MSEYSNENTGVAFHNTDRKHTMQGQFKGYFRLHSEERTHWVDCSGRVDNEGKAYLDVRLSEMLEKGADYSDAEKFEAKLYAFTKQNDKAPDFKGMVTLPNGDELEMSCWKRKSGKGDPLLSFSLGEPYTGGSGGSVNTDKEFDIFDASSDDSDDSFVDSDYDDIPF